MEEMEWAGFLVLAAQVMMCAQPNLIVVHRH
jgi:hypothetical protein